jgi:hypothetical protein
MTAARRRATSAAADMAVSARELKRALQARCCSRAAASAHQLFPQALARLLHRDWLHGAISVMDKRPRHARGSLREEGRREGKSRDCRGEVVKVTVQRLAAFGSPYYCTEVHRGCAQRLEPWPRYGRLRPWYRAALRPGVCGLQFRLYRKVLYRRIAPLTRMVRERASATRARALETVRRSRAALHEVLKTAASTSALRL